MNKNRVNKAERGRPSRGDFGFYGFALPIYLVGFLYATYLLIFDSLWLKPYLFTVFIISMGILFSYSTKHIDLWEGMEKAGF